MSKVPALLKWIGNKQRFAETIISYMPEQFNNYYEPFLGSGAVMAQLLYQNSTTSTPSFTHSYASDILPFLIDIFNIVKYDPQQIKNYYSKEIEELSAESEVTNTMKLEIDLIAITMPSISVFYHVHATPE